jgi:hypothetical protein
VDIRKAAKTIIKPNDEGCSGGEERTLRLHPLNGPAHLAPTSGHFRCKAGLTLIRHPSIGIRRADGPGPVTADVGQKKLLPGEEIVN